MNLKIKTDAGIELPTYSTDGSAGMDVRASINTHNADMFRHIERDWMKGPEYDDEGNEIVDSIYVEPGETVIIPTGLYFEIPEGYEIQVRPRSGLAAKNSVTILNTPGTIDSDYRGELKIILINHSRDNNFVIKNGDRIAQIVMNKYEKMEFETVGELGDTQRSSGGFGSTGIK